MTNMLWDGSDRTFPCNTQLGFRSSITKLPAPWVVDWTIDQPTHLTILVAPPVLRENRGSVEAIENLCALPLKHENYAG